MKHLTFDDDDFTEVRDVTVTRMDLVDKAANGTPFLLMKAAAPENPSIFGPEDVTALLTKAEEPNMTDSTTAVDEVVKADAPTLDDVLIEPSGAAAVAASVPGSPEWEQVDANTAANAYQVLTRVENTLEVLSEREGIESASSDGDWEDSDNQWALSDAAAAVEYAKEVVAVYAADEQTEADETLEKGASERPIDQIMKAVTSLDMNDLLTVETFKVLRKAGRTLSSSNETKLRSASESIQSVLDSLPSADTVQKKEAATVAAAPSTVQTTVEVTVDPDKLAKAKEDLATIAEADELAKADDTDASAAAGLQAVYDANGKLIGVVDPSAIQKILGADTDSSAAAAQTDATAASDAADPNLVAKSAEAEVDDDTNAPLTKGAVQDLIKAALDDARAEDAAVIKSLEGEIEHLKAPAKSRVVTHGAKGEASPVSRDGSEIAKSAGDEAIELRKRSIEAPDAATQVQVDNERMQKAVEMISKGNRDAAAIRA